MHKMFFILCIYVHMLIFLLKKRNAVLARLPLRRWGWLGGGAGSVCPFGLFVDTYCGDLGCLKRLGLLFFKSPERTEVTHI